MSEAKVVEQTWQMRLNCQRLDMHRLEKGDRKQNLAGV